MIKKNVLFIMADQLRWDYLSCAGHPTLYTPNIDALPGRRNWLFMGSQLVGELAELVMSFLQSAKLHRHDPSAYRKDVLTKLPTQLNSRIEEMLPHAWQRAG